VSESKQSLDPNDPSYYAPSRSRDKINAPAPSDKNRQALSVPRGHDDKLASLRSFRGGNSLTSTSSDAFADAVARMLREQIRTGDAPAVLRRRSSIGFAVKLGAAVACAALIALGYVVFFSPAQDASDDGVLSALRPWQSTQSSPPAAPLQRASTLMVRNHSGFMNEPLELGVSVDAPDPAATVTVKGMPPGARLTAGVPLSFTEWRVPAVEISTAMVIPPADFVGELNLSAELRNAEGAALVTSFMQLVWRAAAPATALVTANAAPAAAKPAPQSPQPLAPQAMLQQPAPQAAPQQASPQQQPTQQQPSTQPPAPPQSQTVAALPTATATTTPPPASRADAPRELSPNEIASMVRRAQELLANGDVKAARLLLLRAAEAHDARAALSLAKTFDPIALRQLNTADPGPDLAQARNWYQRAREWGSPEAQRQLDALASYR
jgi:hypothetical protein